MEELALGLRMLYSVDHSIDTTMFYELARLVRERAGTAAPRPVTDQRLFEIESGIIAGWFNLCGQTRPLELFPYHWEEVGQPPPRLVFGKGSGLASLDQVPGAGPEQPEEIRRAILAEVKRRSLDTKSLLSAEEVGAIVQRVHEQLGTA
jgi:isopropylmalate/homocitrate/citramalate synthase